MKKWDSENTVLDTYKNFIETYNIIFCMKIKLALDLILAAFVEIKEINGIVSIFPIYNKYNANS